MRFVAIALLTCTFLLAAETWKGKWSSDNSGNAGEIRFVLETGPNVVFTVGDQEVKTTNVTVKADGTELEIAYDFEIQGYRLRSTVKGTLKEGKLSGKYTTRSLEDGSSVDSGTVTASQH